MTKDCRTILPATRAGRYPPGALRSAPNGSLLEGYVNERGRVRVRPRRNRRWRALGQRPFQTFLMYPSISPLMVAMGSWEAAKIGGFRRSSRQFSLRRIWRRYATLRSIASMYGLEPP